MAKIGVPQLARKRRPGAPRGNRNAWKTGLHTADVKDLRRRIRAWRRRVRTVLAGVEEEVRARREAAAKITPACESAVPQAKLTARPLLRQALDVSE